VQMLAVPSFRSPDRPARRCQIAGSLMLIWLAEFARILRLLSGHWATRWGFVAQWVAAARCAFDTLAHHRQLVAVDERDEIVQQGVDVVDGRWNKPGAGRAEGAPTHPVTFTPSFMRLSRVTLSSWRATSFRLICRATSSVSKLARRPLPRVPPSVFPPTTSCRAPARVSMPGAGSVRACQGDQPAVSAASRGRVEQQVAHILLLDADALRV
jgi:hypothetical protein